MIADEAVLSNYDSESVSDGWELTIDDDVFALTESDTETIGLPDGGVGSELVTPSGVEASEFIAPDGSVVWQGDVIPDTAIAQYDATELTLNNDDSVETWTDVIGGFDLTDGSPPTYKTNVQNGNAVVRFDGVDDKIYIDDVGLTENQPVSIAFVAKQNAGSERGMFGSGNDSTDFFYTRTDDGEEWRMFAGSDVQSNSNNHNNEWNIHFVVFNGSNSFIRLNGSEVASGDAGGTNLEGFLIGDISVPQDRFLEGDVGEALIYETALDGSTLDSEEQRLSDKWGISIA